MYQNKINKGFLLLNNKMIDNIHRKYSESLKYKLFLKSLIAPSFCYRILQAEL